MAELRFEVGQPRHGGKPCRRFSLGGESVTLGREADNDLVADDPKMRIKAGTGIDVRGQDFHRSRPSERGQGILTRTLHQ